MPRIATLTLNPTVDVATGTPQVRHTSKLRCTAPRRDPGGGGINVARVVRILGGDGIAVYPAGGPWGAVLTSLLDGLDIPQQRVDIAGETRESFTVNEEESGRQFRFVLPGPTLAAEELEACLAAIEALDPAPAFLVVSGSNPPGVPPSFHESLMALARRIDARVVLDSSGAALRHAVEVGGLHLMKPSLRELGGLLGQVPEGEAAQAEAVHGLVARGAAEIVVLSLGEKGALMATRDGVERLAPFRVPAQSAVGAGDSMVAAMTLALARGLPPGDAVRYGMAAGAAAVMSPGTELCRREDVERLYAEGAPTPA
ncbi:1-phosphofructokinase family hexose kinase [Coralloluteibacterium thermophilus]|uniref:Phosphofructokinase n=1 Tax=Coralloluteibacterium thermophilum TaxID=2707049 RepID=A0ABV9NJ05_9GAMM